jgi:hypothetical protein
MPGAGMPGFLNNGLKRLFKSYQSLLVQVSRYRGSKINSLKTLPQ